MTDIPPASLGFSGAAEGGFACSPASSSPVACSLDGPLPAGESRALELTFEVLGDFGSSVTNIAQVSGLTPGGARSVAEDTAAGSIAPAPTPPAIVALPQTGVSPGRARTGAAFATLLGVVLVVGVRRGRQRTA